MQNNICLVKVKICFSCVKGWFQKELLRESVHEKEGQQEGYG
jgi:hypothetical protein